MHTEIYDLADRIKHKQAIFFLGAGASCDAPSNLPISTILLKEIAERVALPTSTDSQQEAIERIAKGIRFEVFFQALITALPKKAIAALDIMTSGQANYIHDFIALLAVTHHCPLVLTTNFDLLLENALSKRGCAYSMWHLPKHFRETLTKTKRFKVIKLHGSLRDSHGQQSTDSIAISVNQVGKAIPPHKRRFLQYILKRYDLVFVGYSGLDDFDLAPLLLTTKSPKKIFWIKHESSGLSSWTPSNRLRKQKQVPLEANDERIVASRQNGVLFQGKTHWFLNALSKELFRQPIKKPAPPADKRDYGYLDTWANDTEIKAKRNFVNGLLYESLERHQEAIRFFELVPNSSPDVEEALYHKAVCLRRGGQPKAARKQLTLLAIGSRWSKSAKSKALVQLGLLENQEGNLALARKHLKRVPNMTLSDGYIFIAANNNLGMSYLFEAERLQLAGKSKKRIYTAASSALYYLTIAKKAVCRLGSPKEVANICGNVGLANVFIKHYGRAKKNFFEALRVFQSLHVYSEEASCLDNIGFFYKMKALRFRESSQAYRDGLAAALSFNVRAHTLKLKVSTLLRVAMSKHNIGDTYFLLGDVDKAIWWLTEAKKSFESEKHTYYVGEVSRAIARAKSTH
jgi:tetratricopeptide (TPR) repeat protein